MHSAKDHRAFESYMVLIAAYESATAMGPILMERVSLHNAPPAKTYLKHQSPCHRVSSPEYRSSARQKLSSIYISILEANVIQVCNSILPESTSLITALVQRHTLALIAVGTPLRASPFFPVMEVHLHRG